MIINSFQRGDIYWANLNPTRGSEQSGIRPVLIISQNVFNRHSKTVIAMAITSKKPRQGFPLTLKISSVQMPKQSWIKLSQVRILSTERLTSKIGTLAAAELSLAIEGLNEIIGD